MQSKGDKSCLLVSYGPVPTPQYQTVEGGGMRVWGLAKGLKANGVDVVVAINNAFPQELDEHEGVRLVNWGLDEQFAQLVNTFDSVIASYCMGDPSVFIVDHIEDSVQLILDAYVPIYIEVSARESVDINSEYSAYADDIIRFNKVLRRGDFFLCANESQKVFYTGVLSSLGIINPHSYRDERLLIVPFGIHNAPLKALTNPFKKLGIKDNEFKIMWFGGIYPWFHIEELLTSILALEKNKFIKFIFVGGKNPFNPNPDFSKQYDKAVLYAKDHDLTNNSVFFVDWVDFDERVNWFKHADLVISLNNPGEENKYSWRTRVMDYVWGELAILTNGSDPLSDHLISSNAAILLPVLSADAITSSLTDLYLNQPSLEEIRKAIRSIKPSYFWETLTIPISLVINEGSLPYLKERSFKRKLGLVIGDQEMTNGSESRNKIQKIVDITPRLVSKIRNKGVMNSVKLATNIARTQVKNKRTTGRTRKYIFISHPINNTGAPIVLLQIIKEFTLKYGAKNIQLITPNIEGDQLQEMRRLGIKIDKAVFGVGFRFIRMQLGIRKNDFVLMNTAAIYDNYRDFIMLWLKLGRLKHAFWFIHEDKAQLPVIHKEFLDDKNLARVHSLLEEDKLTILTPSHRTKEEYDDLLKSPDRSIRVVNLNVAIETKFKRMRKTGEYNSMDFLLSGTPSDGRKGQLLALTAFYSFIKDYYEKAPGNYRDFKIHLVAIENDYISQQIRWISESLLKKHVVIYPSLPKKEALEITSSCNAVICCSLNETFGLYVAEGMSMGHVVLRNNSAGIDEQLKDGVNGYFIDHTNINQFASVIEKILNNKTASNKMLQDMGISSQSIIKDYNKNNYLSQIEIQQNNKERNN